MKLTRYDSQYRLDRVTEPGGRYLQVTYKTYSLGQPPHPFDVIDYVQAFDGRDSSLPIETVQYHYDVIPPSRADLIGVDYDDHTHATYTYVDGNVTIGGLVFPRMVQTCDDVRFDGPMKQIEYEYLFFHPDSRIHDIAWGQVIAEKNFRTHQPITTITYPPDCCPAPSPFDPIRFQRTEVRADGKTRLFQYSDYGGILTSYTDFSQPPHTSFLAEAQVSPGSSHYTKTFINARAYSSAVQRSTVVEHEGVIGAAVKVTFPHAQGLPPPEVTYDYGDPSSPSYPYYLWSKTDENLNPTFYDRLTSGPHQNRVWRIRYPDNTSEEFTYHPLGLVEDHTMTSRGIEHFRYDARGLKTLYWPPATLSDPAPDTHPTKYFYYDATTCNGRRYLIDRLYYVEDPLGHRTWYDYNARGLVIRVTHHDGKFTQSEYNDDGTLAWTADENYPNAGATPGAGAAGGQAQRTRYEYDQYKRVIRVTKPFSSPTINIYYDGDDTTPDTEAALWHTTSSIYQSISPLGKVTKFLYDENFRLTDKIVAPGTNEEAKTSYGHDEVGNQTSVTEPTGQLQGVASVSVYDERNRRTQLTDALGQSTWWEYDQVGNMTKETRQDGKFRTWDLYDKMNRVKQTTGFRLEVTFYDYDHGNLASITQRDIPGAKYEYLYDELNRKYKTTYPVDATTQQSGQHRVELWWYDTAGNISTYKSPAGKYKHFHYDVRNRQDHSYWNTSFDNGVFDIQKANKAIGDELIMNYDDASRPTYIGSSGWTSGQSVSTVVAYHYDDANHQVSEDQVIAAAWQTPPPMRTVISTDDLDGNPASLSVAGVPGEDYSFSYDYTQRQKLFHINKQGANGGQFFEYTYDKNDNLEKRQDLLQGRDYTRYSHDMANRLTWCSHFTGQSTPGSMPIPAYSMTSYGPYDSINRLESVGRKRRLQDPFMGESFLYDDDNQLSNVTYNVDLGNRTAPPGVDDDVVQLAKDSSKEEAAALEPDSVREPFVGLVPPMPDTLMSRQVSYSNDAIRRNQMTETINDVTTVTNYNPNALNQSPAVSRCVSGQSNCDPITTDYDESFNLSGFDGWIYSYDAENRLVSANGYGHSATFIYDGLGRCVRRTIDGVQTVITYDDWKPIIEWSGSGEFVAWNLYGPGPDEILVRYQPNTGGGPGTTAYLHYHLDGLGNVEFLLSVNNLGLEKYSYDAFGQPTIKNWDGVVQKKSPNGNRFMFTGREYIYTLGLYDYRHRMYHPQLGNFMQVDPVGFKGDPMNLYRYCNGNPVMHGDPTGLFISDLTSTGGGDWIKSGIIPVRDKELIGEARAMDSIVAQMSNSKIAPTHGTKEYETAFKAAVSVATEAMQLAKSGGRQGTEAWASFGKDPDTDTYGVSSVRRGSGENPKFKDAYTPERGERVQTSEITRGDLAERYNMTGFVLAHRIYNDTYVQKDLYRARDHQLSALIVLPPKPGSSTNSPILRWWEYGTRFPNF